MSYKVLMQRNKIPPPTNNDIDMTKEEKLQSWILCIFLGSQIVPIGSHPLGPCSVLINVTSLIEKHAMGWDIGFGWRQ